MNLAFELMNSRLYECTVYKTEQASYLYFSLHHVISDGASFQLMLNELTQMYKDDSYQGKQDYYYSVMDELLHGKDSPAYEEEKEYRHKRLLSSIVNNLQQMEYERILLYIQKQIK